MVKQIAIYGKGGIGKSTVSSHISVAMARRGHKVLLIGCDPKTDSTFTLLGGSMPTPILDVISANRNYDADLIKATIHPGYCGVLCCEAGGPEPGVGCAGRGIIVAIEALHKTNSIDRLGVDTVIYDVPGDVVCGGFAMPIRTGNAQEVYIVTSSEFSSLYAANNIARGIARFSANGGALLGGVIANLRGGGNADTIITYAKRIGSQIVGCIPWEERISEAEQKGMTIYESMTGSPALQAFEDIVDNIDSGTGNVCTNPLSRDELYELCLR